MYDEGWSVRRNARNAARWYLRAAEGGLREAYYFVAWAYDAGEGVTRDRRKAAAWYRRAVLAGDRDAELALAVLMLWGAGATTR